MAIDLLLFCRLLCFLINYVLTLLNLQNFVAWERRKSIAEKLSFE